jgi:predicted N-acetyltransferase YhbS
MEYRALRQTELQLWSDLCNMVFNKNSENDQHSFLQLYENDPWKDQNSILVAVDSGQIVSTVQVYCRFTMLGTQEIKTGFIGGVCTNPDYTGQGLASKLLNHAVDVMRENEFHISMLTSGIGSFYERLGWQNVHWHWKTMNFAVDDTPFDDFTVRPIRVEDNDQIRLIHAMHSKKYNGPIVRNNDDYWNHKIQIAKKACWVAIDTSGDIIAYLWLYAREEDNYICVIEYGQAASATNILDRMVNKICLDYGWENCRLRTQSGVHLNNDITETATYTGLMYRLIEPFEVQNEKLSTTEQLIDYLNRNNNPDSSDFLNWDHENV